MSEPGLHIVPKGTGPDETPTEPSQGRVYGGRYAVAGEIGQGGMGRVLRARDLKLGRDVALKVLAPGPHDEQQRMRFEQEARAAGALNHPNILAVHDVGEHAGEPYIVSELLEGRTLRAALPVAPDRVLDLALQLASGLAAAHRKGIVHRDVKPENLFLTQDGQLKILDFGIAKLLAPPRDGLRTDTGAVIGTPAYMSPEQVRGESADARTDVFSFGVVLHELLSGRGPFERATSVETAYAILHDPPSALPGSALSHVVARCLEKDPAARYASGGELYQDLTALAQGARTEAGKRLRRRVTLIAAAGLACTLAIAFIARRYFTSRRTTPSQNVVAVLPFTVRGTGQSAYLGEGMIDLLATTLVNSATRTVNARALLKHLAHEKLSPDPEGGRKVASQFGARQFVLGSVVEVGSRLRIHAAVYDADGDAPVREAKAEGEAAKIFDLVDNLSGQIRVATSPVDAPGQPNSPADRHLRLAAVTTSSPEALKAYLEGHQECRRLHYPEAQAAFERALEADPSFALAHYWLSAFLPIDEPARAIAEAKRAVELGKDHPRRDQRVFTAGQAAYLGKWAEEERLAREVLASHPDDVDAHMLLREALMHGGQLRGVPYAEVVAAIERFIALAEGQFGQQEVVLNLLIEGEFEKARALLERELARGAFADESVRLWARWTLALLTGDREARRQILVEIPKVKLAGIGGLSTFFRSARLIPGGLDDAEAIARIKLEGAPVDAHEWFAALDLMRGRLRAAARKHKKAQQAIADKSDNRADFAGVSLATPYAPIDRGRLLADRDAVVAFVHRPDGDPLSRYWQLQMRGMLSARAGDAADAEKAAAELDRPDIGGEGSTLGPDWALEIRATVAWQAGRLQEALALLARVRGEVPVTAGKAWLAAVPPIRYARAELLFLLGRYEEAERFFLADSLSYGDGLIPPRLRRLGQLAERRGDKKKAIAYYTRFVEYWSDCDPELRPQVDEARARLAALEGNR